LKKSGVKIAVADGSGTRLTLWKFLWKLEVLQNVRFPSISEYYGHFGAP
jgi:hypothetical protein